jgi:protein-S-isoprenylcysteine O-methyltransferase Ste14
VFWVMKTDSFAASVIQVEAEQRVIQTGPYALVRHPMYTGIAVTMLATPLALGSYVALPAFALIIPVLIYRLIHEEGMLRRDLQGYAEYCDRTPFRLIPRVW